MKKRILQVILTCLLISIAWVGAHSQAPASEQSVDFLGSVNGEVYRNDFFGMELSIPKGWKLVDSETTAASRQIGLDILKGKNERSNKALSESASKEVVLVNVAKKPVGSSENATFVMAARKQASPAITPSMVAEATKSILINSPGMKLLKDTETEMIAGRKFAGVQFSFAAETINAKIKFYVTMVDSYSVSFALSGINEADVVELDKIVTSIRFSKK